MFITLLLFCFVQPSKGYFFTVEEKTLNSSLTSTRPSISITGVKIKCNNVNKACDTYRTRRNKIFFTKEKYASCLCYGIGWLREEAAEKSSLGVLRVEINSYWTEIKGGDGRKGLLYWFYPVPSQGGTTNRIQIVKSWWPTVPYFKKLYTCCSNKKRGSINVHPAASFILPKLG